MNRFLLAFSFVINSLLFAQTDYSDNWEDFFSYNNVKDFKLVDNSLYAMTDNAVFIYDIVTKEIKKISSVNGLSGETTSAIHYNKKNQRLVIGYENGLIEVVDKTGKITISKDIVNFNQTGLKRINSIYEYNNKLYLATSFAIVEYNIEKLEFGDTYFIGKGSSSVNINDITVSNNIMYASTKEGVYVADINNPNLIDAANWDLKFTGLFDDMVTFNNRVYVTSKNIIYQIKDNTSEPILTLSEDIKSIKSNNSILSVSLSNKAVFYNTSLVKIAENTTNQKYPFNLQTATLTNNTVFLATKEYGILRGNSSVNMYQEIHPEGPLMNDVFSIKSYNNNLWVVYGGYNNTYTPLQRKLGFSHFTGTKWINTPYNNNFPLGDLVDIIIDETKNNRVFISMFGDTDQINTALTGGLLEVENDKIKRVYNQLNSPLENILEDDTNRVTIRIPSGTFDREGNLWVTNIGADKRIKKLSPSGQWTGYNINELFQTNKYGMNEIVQDKSNNFWIGTRRNGAYVFNEKGNRKIALSTEINRGGLPNANVRTIAVDNSNRVWLGTGSGLVVYNQPSSIFDVSGYNAKPIIIEDDGIAKKLLGDQKINSIVIDGADNKWFGTDGAGVLYTNSDGQKTLANFNKSNSPLPSNRIVKIAVDKGNGKVYFATNNGIVAYNSKVAPFGETLTQVYAYPNPVLKEHDVVVIAGMNGNHLPKGTNVKIVDASGNLVYETNVVEGQQIKGGKVVWNKRNLAGTKVASGVYIALLSTEEAEETTTVKFAIIN